MMFRFSLQRVLDLREKREQEAAVTLASARGRAEMAREALDELERAREQGMLRVAAVRGGGATVGHLRNLGLVIESLEERLEVAHGEVEVAEARVADCVADLVSASRDRRVLDRLRDKQLVGWRAETVQRDRKAMDAIALSRHARGAASPEE